MVLQIYIFIFFFLELKYFQTGLTWLGEYNMRDVLMKGGVLPDSNSSTDLTSIWLAVKTQLGYNPSIHCLWDKVINIYLLTNTPGVKNRSFSGCSSLSFDALTFLQS